MDGDASATDKIVFAEEDDSTSERDESVEGGGMEAPEEISVMKEVVGALTKSSSAAENVSSVARKVVSAVGFAGFKVAEIRFIFTQFRSTTNTKVDEPGFFVEIMLLMLSLSEELCLHSTFASSQRLFV